MNPIASLPGAGLTIGEMPDLRLSSPIKTQKPESGETLFQDFFDAALRVYKDTNANTIASEQLYVDLATGKTDDILAVVLAQEKASASLNFTMQITGRVIEAYREIMRMQV